MTSVGKVSRRMTVFGLTMLAGYALAAEPADLVITNARVYTADPDRSIAEAIAVRDGRIVFVGSTSAAMLRVGPQTKLERLAGGLVLPGLIDSHIHPIDMIEVDMCSLASRPRKTLRALSRFVRSCIEKYRPRPGQ